MLKTLTKDVASIGKRRVKHLHAWLIIGGISGVFLGLVFAIYPICQINYAQATSFCPYAKTHTETIEGIGEKKAKLTKQEEDGLAVPKFPDDFVFTPQVGAY